MVSDSHRTTPLIIYIHLEGSLHLVEPQSLSGEMGFHLETQVKHFRLSTRFPSRTPPGHLLISLSQRPNFSTDRSQHLGTVFPSAPDDLLLLNLS